MQKVHIGRPKKSIDLEKAGKLAKLHCTQKEIAYVLDISIRTLQRNKEFCRIYKKETATSLASLRKAQFEKAIKYNDTTMQIWLGKVLLGQSEKTQKNTDVIPKIVLSETEKQYFEAELDGDKRIVRRKSERR